MASSRTPSATGALEQRQARSTRRRAVVAGAVEGSEAGPVGVAAGAASGARVSKSRASSPARATPARAKRATRGRAKGFTIKTMNAPGSGALFAEYFAGVLIIVLDLFTEGPNKGYTATMSKVMIRLTAITVVFFVLFLMTGSKRGGQAAVWLGLIVDLGIIFTASRAQTFTTTADEISGKGSGITTDALTSALTVPATPPGIQLPDE